MRRLLAIAAVTVATLLTEAAAQVAPRAPAEMAADLFETVVRTPVTVKLLGGGERSGDMIITHYRPTGAGPFPLVVMSHGRAGTPEQRAKPARQRALGVVRYWVAKGYAVVVPTRLGYGATGVSPDTEESGKCDNRNFRPMSEAASHQIRTAVAFAATLPFIDKTRVVLMGQSVGGLATIVTVGKGVPGLVAAINMAGGSGGNPRERPGAPCGPDRLASVFAAAGKAGAKASIPTLWLYAENDKFWGNQFPRQWHLAYGKGGSGNATFIMVPPVGDEGHRLIDHPDVWRPHVDRFIATIPAKGN